jgi:hypothetical protein
MRGPNLTKEARERLRSELRLAAANLEPIDPADISRRYGIAPASIRGIASRAGIPVRVMQTTMLERIMAVASVEKTRADVARELGEDPEKVQRAYKYARNKGIIVPQQRGVKRGFSLKAQLKAYKLPPEVEAWLLVQLPSESGLHDLIRAIILDAYHEELGK